MTNVKETLDNLLCLPRQYNKGDASAYELLKGSGYLEHHDEISSELLEDALRRNPQFLQDWIQFSEDKRSSGWSLRNTNDTTSIGYTPEKGEVSKFESKTYQDPIVACAAFIKLELEDIRIVLMTAEPLKNNRPRVS